MGQDLLAIRGQVNIRAYQEGLDQSLPLKPAIRQAHSYHRHNQRLMVE
jgi:hypothetical protein